MIKGFLRYRRSFIALWLISAAVSAAVCALAGANVGGYIALLISVFAALFLAADYVRYSRARRELMRVRRLADGYFENLPEPLDGVQADLAQIILLCEDARTRLRNTLAAEHRENDEYYTLWVHQIKTPLAAMRLVLDTMGAEETPILKRELLKLEQYADMALKYAKLRAENADIVPERAQLLPIVKNSVKKFSLPFVYKGLSLSIEPLAQTVYTDKKWLGFIIEQLISNAVKYTKTGGVRIYMRGAELVIEDSGVGIAPADLPRVFEKGYTGYNGRMDDRASGIGLYLSARAAEQIGLALRLESEQGRGTRAILTFPREDGETAYTNVRNGA